MGGPPGLRQDAEARQVQQGQGLLQEVEAGEEDQVVAVAQGQHPGEELRDAGDLLVAGGGTGWRSGAPPAGQPVLGGEGRRRFPRSEAFGQAREALVEVEGLQGAREEHGPGQGLDALREVRGGVRAGDLEPPRRDPGEQVSLGALAQHGAELGPQPEELDQRMAGRRAHALRRGLGDQLPDARFLGLEGLGIQLQLPVRALAGRQQLEAAPELAREAARQGERFPCQPCAGPRSWAELQGGREPVGGPGRQVVGLVEEDEVARALLRRRRRTACTVAEGEST